MYFSLLENEKKKINTYSVLIPSYLPNVLKQTRSKMSKGGVEDLKVSFKDIGQKTAGTIFAFKKEEAKKYLTSMNWLWKSDYQIYDFDPIFFPEKLDYFYLFVVAGHRRLKACMESKQDYYADIEFDQTFIDAIRWQMAENLHEQVAMVDLIISTTALWLFIKGKQPDMTIKKFASQYAHRSANWVSNILKFSELPYSIQERINNGNLDDGVNYVVLVEFARLYSFSKRKNKPISESYLNQLINISIVKNKSLKDVKDACSKERREIEGQLVLFQINDSDRKEADRRILSMTRLNATSEIKKARDYVRNANNVTQNILNQDSLFGVTINEKENVFTRTGISLAKETVSLGEQLYLVFKEKVHL